MNKQNFRQNATRTVDEKGKAPDSKVPHAFLAWSIADQLQKDDAKRAEKRSRLYKQYKRFPPTAYSKIISQGHAWQSNVCWGQMKFIIDSQKSSLYDLVSEAPQLVSIESAYGDMNERLMNSQKISFAFDTILKLWPQNLINCEQDILETLLYGKGIEIWDAVEGWQSQNKSLNDFLVPDNARYDFANVEFVAVRHEYSPNELYRFIKDGDSVWNELAVIDALQFSIVRNENGQTREDFLHKIAAGEINLSSFCNEEIKTWQLYVREFDDTITKLVFLRDYTPVISGYNQEAKKVMSEEDAINTTGFLYVKKNFCKSWSELRTIFSDAAEEGKFHGIQGQAEQAYVGARQYDITMNRIVDAIYINMMCMLDGGSPDANKKLREMTFSPFIVLPDGLKIGQQQININTNEAIQTLTYQMRDLYSGMSVYKPNQATNGGRQRTRGEAELDAAEQSKVSGSQLKRYNEQRSIYYQTIYKKFIKSGTTGPGGELRKLFNTLLEEMNVPKDAAAWDSIRSIKAKMLSGAGSQSMKVMAARETIALTGMTAANPGQELAIREAIAAWQGSSNVDTFRPIVQDVFTEATRVIAMENSAMSLPEANPENFRVNPTDPHIEHIMGHYSDMMFDSNKLFQLDQANGDAEDMLEIIIGLNQKGGHVMAHMNYIFQDKTKEDQGKAFMTNLAKIQNVVDQITPKVQQRLQEEAQQNQQQQDPEMERKMALAAIEVDTAKKLAEIKMGAIATSHEVKKEITQDKAANDIAISREKAIQSATDERIKKSVKKPNQTKPK